MESVLISINPKWCDLIVLGKKTIEVRKTRPKMGTPFKCYIYCTKDRHNALVVRNGQAKKIICDNSDTAIYCGGCPGNGKVIGEFVCDEILVIAGHKFYDDVGRFIYDRIQDACLTEKEIDDYLDGKYGYGWHISNLVIYDKPMELSEFQHCGANYHYNPTVSQPPQSWFYAEEVRK